MSQTSNRYSVAIESNDFLKPKHDSNTKGAHSGSLGDLTRSEFKHSSPHLNREDSVSSKNSFTSLFKKSNETPFNGFYNPRPEKTLNLFETILSALNELHLKYSTLKSTEVDVETQDYNEICSKLDDRINLIQNLMGDYRCLLEDKDAELKKIESHFRAYLSNKNSKESKNLCDNETYWLMCKDLYINESKLERCSGKLQFQIMELDFIGKINPLDQYELSIRLNEATKFKTRIKIEKNGHQQWDSRNFFINPVIDDFLYIKFSEIKSLNKTVVLTEKKLPFVNNLIRSEPSIFTLWLSPVGTIKLNVIVQWNSMLEDPNLQTHLIGIDYKFSDQMSKNDVSLRSRSASHKYTTNRLSVNIESLFRSSRLNHDSRSNSMDNIVEDVEEEKIPKEIRKSDIPYSHAFQITKQDDKIEETAKKENQDIPAPIGNIETAPSITINIIEEENIQINDKENSKVILNQESIDIELPEEEPKESNIVQMRHANNEKVQMNDIARDDLIVESQAAKIEHFNKLNELEYVQNEENETLFNQAQGDVKSDLSEVEMEGKYTNYDSISDTNVEMEKNNNDLRKNNDVTQLIEDVHETIDSENTIKETDNKVTNLGITSDIKVIDIISVEGLESSPRSDSQNVHEVINSENTIKEEQVDNEMTDLRMTNDIEAADIINVGDLESSPPSDNLHHIMINIEADETNNEEKEQLLDQDCSKKDLSPSQVHGCEDNEQVIESPLVNLISCNSSNDEGVELSTRNNNSIENILHPEPLDTNPILGFVALDEINPICENSNEGELLSEYIPDSAPCREDDKSINVSHDLNIDHTSVSELPHASETDNSPQKTDFEDSLKTEISVPLPGCEDSSNVSSCSQLHNVQSTSQPM